MIRGACAAKEPFPGKIFAPCVPERRFAGLFRMHSAHILPKPAHFGYTAAICCHELAIFPSEATFRMHEAQNLPRIAARERISRVFCHRQAPENAPRRNLATARPLGTHRASILPLPVRPRAHQGAILPPSDARKRISRAFCHRRAPGNASRHNLATTGRPRRTLRAPMRHGSRSAHVRGSGCLPFVYAARHPDAAELRVLQAVRALAVAQPADCRVAAERVVNIAKLVSVPQRRSATTPCATMSCAAAPQHHALQHRVAMHHDAMRRTRRSCRR